MLGGQVGILSHDGAGSLKSLFLTKTVFKKGCAVLQVDILLSSHLGVNCQQLAVTLKNGFLTFVISRITSFQTAVVLQLRGALPPLVPLRKASGAPALVGAPPASHPEGHAAGSAGSVSADSARFCSGAAGACARARPSGGPVPGSRPRRGHPAGFVPLQCSCCPVAWIAASVLT